MDLALEVEEKIKKPATAACQPLRGCTSETIDSMRITVDFDTGIAEEESPIERGGRKGSHRKTVRPGLKDSRTDVSGQGDKKCTKDEGERG